MLETKSIPEEIQFSIKEKGYDKLTTVQSLVLDPGNNDKDLASSQTGSAKHLLMGYQYRLLDLKKFLIQITNLRP